MLWNVMIEETGEGGVDELAMLKMRMNKPAIENHEYDDGGENWLPSQFACFVLLVCPD